MNDAIVLPVGHAGRVVRKWSAAEHDFVKSNYAEMTCLQMANALGRTQSQIRNRCWQFGYEFKRGEGNPFVWSEGEIELLKVAYSTCEAASELGLDAIARQLGRHKTNISRKARELGLTNINRQKLKPEDRVPPVIPKFATSEERKANQSSITKTRIAEKGHPRGALGMKHTDANKQLFSTNSKRWWNSLTNDQREDHTMKAIRTKEERGYHPIHARGSWKAGWREIGDQRCYFRSRWEANYGRYLEWLRSIGEITSWEHEAQTFWFKGIKRGVVSYLPDFKVTNPSGSIEWHEVKGWMDSRSKTTIARMAKYHPSEKLIVIREKQYKEIGRKVSSLIPGWESESKDYAVRITVQADA